MDKHVASSCLCSARTRTHKCSDEATLQACSREPSKRRARPVSAGLRPDCRPCLLASAVPVVVRGSGLSRAMVAICPLFSLQSPSLRGGPIPNQVSGWRTRVAPILTLSTEEEARGPLRPTPLHVVKYHNVQFKGRLACLPFVLLHVVKYHNVQFKGRLACLPFVLFGPCPLEDKIASSR